MRIRTNRICFTINNYTEADVDTLFDNVLRSEEKVGFFVCGDEVGEKGTPHLQGYLRYKGSERFGIKHWKQVIGNRAHIEPARGSDSDNEKYCKKEGKFAELGAVCENTQSVHAQMLNDLEESANIQDWCRKYPEEAFKYINQATRLRELLRQTESFELPSLYDWQERCIRLLDRQDDRKILFVVDEQGGSGKTVLGKWILDNRMAFGCQGMYYRPSGSGPAVGFSITYFCIPSVYTAAAPARSLRTHFRSLVFRWKSS